MVASKTASCFQLGVRFPDGTLQTTAAVGGGGITSVGLVGTANQITVTGSSPITTSGSWTLSFPSTVDITNLVISGTTSFKAGSIAIAALASDTISLADSTGLFTVTGSPATLGGTLTLSAFASQSQNYVLAGPGSGGSGAAAFRALVSGDIPNNAASTTGSSGSCTGNAATATVASGLTGTPSISITNLTVGGTTSFVAGSIATAAIAAGFLPEAGGTMTGVLTLESSAAGLKDSAGSTGSSGNVLTVDGSGNPVWAAPATSGTVTSFSAGGLSPLFTTSVATATTTPALTFALSNASAGTVLGNATGSAAGPGYTATPVLGLNTSVAGTLGLATSAAAGATITLQNLGALTAYNFNLPITVGAAGSVLTSQAGGSTSMTWTAPGSLAVAWSSLVAATANLTLNNVAYTTTFQQQTATTAAGTLWTWANTTAATGSTVLYSPSINLAANYYTGSGSAADTWTLGSSIAAGTNGISTLTIAHSGSTGVMHVSIPSIGFNSNNPSPSLIFGTDTTSGFGWIAAGVPAVFVPAGIASAGFRIYANTTLVGYVTSNTTSNFFGLQTGQSNEYLFMQPGGGTAVYGTAFQAQTPFTGVSGLQADLFETATFAPTSGYANFASLKLNPTINNTSVGPTITSAVITSATSAAVTIGSTAGYVTGASVTIANVSTSGFTGLNGTWVVASATATVLTMTTVGLTAKAQAACNGNVLFGAWNPSLGTYTGLNVSVVETAVIAGVNNSLIDCYAGSAGTTPEFRVSNKGVPTVVGGNATVKAGVPSILAAPTKLTGQQAAQSAVSLVASAAAGMWRISYVAYITQVDTESSVLGGVTGFAVNFTDPDDSVAKTSNPTTPTISAGNTTGTTISGDLYVYAKAATAITYNFGYTTTGSGATAMSYSIAVYAEYLA
jgi:hypothetical protein